MARKCCEAIPGVELFDNANLLFEKPLRNPRISLRAHMLAQIVQNSRQSAFLPESARAERGYSKGGVPWENLSLHSQWLDSF
jgi:hypothetical protein